MLEKIKSKLVKFYYMRIKRDLIAYAKHLGVRMGERCQILTDPEVAFGTEPWLIRLGNHVDITYGVQFLNHEGGIWCARGVNPEYEKMDCFLPTVVGDNVMIGVNSLIMPGVHIGSNVIVAGHCVVTADIPDGAVFAGVPGKQISTVEKFIEGLNKREVVPTKKMSLPEKRAYLQKIHPEWFN
jgi:acetyltransferase-like isoleucine patch superfamily enzyme